MQKLLATLVDVAVSKKVSVPVTKVNDIKKLIAGLDSRISKQLAAVMHHEDFQKLEGSWRGLRYLVFSSETNPTLKINVLNISKKELHRDLQNAEDYDQSETWKKVYEENYGTPGGVPYGAMVGDFEFGNTTEDIELLSMISKVSAAGFCPFLTAPSPHLLQLQSWAELKNPPDIARIFDTKAYIKWRAFRDSDESRFVVLTMPRVLSRLPYGVHRPIDEFDFQEVALGPNRSPVQVPHEQFCWMNAAYVLASRLTAAFSETGFCTQIRGAEGGGRVDDLPTYTFDSADGGTDSKCPTEIAITFKREKELSDAGFLPICHFKDTDYAAFIGAQTTQKPVKYDRPDATANAVICTRLPYLMAVSRFSHYLKRLGENKVGTFAEAKDTEKLLDRWINNYVSTNNPGPDEKARRPLAEAKVQVEEVPGKPGSYHAVVHARPWLQMEELTASMRLVARIPQRSN